MGQTVGVVASYKSISGFAISVAHAPTVDSALVQPLQETVIWDVI